MKVIEKKAKYVDDIARFLQDAEFTYLQPLRDKPVDLPDTEMMELAPIVIEGIEIIYQHSYQVYAGQLQLLEKIGRILGDRNITLTQAEEKQIDAFLSPPDWKSLLGSDEVLAEMEYQVKNNKGTKWNATTERLVENILESIEWEKDAIRFGCRINILIEQAVASTGGLI